MFENDYLMHYGIKGQKWGVRRYQNADGSLTTAGRARYSKSSGKRARYGSEGMSSEVYNLNKKIDKYNTRLQKRKAVNDAQSSVSLKRAAAAGLVPTAINAPSAVKAGLATQAMGSLPLGLKIASAGAGLGLGAAINAGGGALIGAVAKHEGRRRSGEARLEKKLTKLVDKRNALDPSQANRQGSVLTKEQYAKQYNKTKGGLSGLTSLGLLGGLAGSAAGQFVKNTRDAEYENYKKNAVAYGSKKKKAVSPNSKISADTNGVWDSKSAPGVYKSIAKYDWSTGVYNSKDAPPELKKAALKRQRMLQKAYLNGDFDNIDDSYDAVVDVYPDQKYMKKWKKFVDKNPTAFNPPF